MRIELGIANDVVEDDLPRQLVDWIQNERIAGLKIDLDSSGGGPGTMGAGLLTFASVVLAAPAVVEMVKSLRAWLISRRPKCRIEIKTEQITIVIDAENIPSQELFENYIAPLVTAAGGEK